MRRRVVITGSGVVTTLGRKVDELWARVCRGESGIRRITAFDTSGYRVHIGGLIEDWSTDGYMGHKEARRLDRFAQLAMVAGIDAVRDSGIDFSKEAPYRCGVILGSGIGGLLEIEVQHTRLLTKGPDPDKLAGPDS